MTFENIKLNIKNMKNIKSYLDFVEKKNLATVRGDNYMNSFINKYKTQVFGKKTSKKIKIINVEINFRTYCDYWKCSQSRRLKDKYNNILATHYVGRGCLMKEEFFDELIEENIKKRKIIYIILDIVDYGLNDDIDYYEYSAHSTVLILMPNGRKYNAYYINSHGKDMLNYDVFSVIISNKKKRTITYDYPVDEVFINSFLSFIENKYDLKINYDFSEEHNYIGVDLQTGDNYGICFIFPYIIWYYFGKYYEKSRWVFSRDKSRLMIKSNKELLKLGKLTECIHGYFVELNIKYKEEYIKGLRDMKYERNKYIKKLDRILEKSQRYFVTKILHIFIQFFCQIISF